MPTMMGLGSRGRSNDFSGGSVPVLLGAGERTACWQSGFGKLLKDRAVGICCYCT